MADTEIKASKEPAKNQYGQNGYSGASSLNPGQTKSPIADMSPPMANVPGLDMQDQLSHRVKMGDDGKPVEYAPHASMKHRSASDGSPGGTIPAANTRLSKSDGKFRPTK
jgi:hypothetical protein